MLSSDFERRRMLNKKEQRKSFWSILETTSLVEAVHSARDRGWNDKKVQVRSERYGDSVKYYVEPFEKDCGCPNILKYADFFDPPVIT